MITHLLLRLSFLVLVLIPILPAHADPFDQANQQFSSGKFEQAAKSYQDIIDTNGPSAAALYNLGNAYQQSGKPGHAILSYERARLLTPRDPDLRTNLRLTRKAAAAFDEPTVHRRIDGALRHFSRNEWSWMLVLPAFFLAGLAVVLALTGLPRMGPRAIVVASSAAALLLLSASAAALYLTRHDARHGIILSEETAVRLSPFESAESLATPRPGRTVRIGAQNGDFHYIEIPATKLSGWVHKKDVAPIIP